MRYLISALVVGIGFLLVWQADWLVNHFGSMEWAEQHLSTEGGTRIFWKILGIIVIIGAFFAMTGVLQSIVGGTFGKWINGGQISQ